MNVAILGASAKKDRYSYKALKMLRERGHAVFPVHPIIKNIEDNPVYSQLRDIKESIHTLTVYLSSEKSNALADQILSLCPQRIIFNPGTENDYLEKVLAEKGIKVQRACTLVLLSTNQF